MGIEIRTPETEAEWRDYYDLRFRVLREPLGQPRGTEKNEGDATALHFAVYDDKKLVAIARLDSCGEQVAQVRFVAVDTSLQGKGYGRLIMEEVERKSIERGDKKMILHARDYALDFYRQLGYILIGPSHKLFGVLQHFLMEKEY